MSTAPILHHFEGSPFSQKLRAMFGEKGLAWRSVRVPQSEKKTIGFVEAGVRVRNHGVQPT